MPAAPLGYPALPEKRRLSNGRPVFAGDVSRLVSALNHCAGVQMRQVWTAIVESRADTVQTYDGVGAAAPLPPASHVVHAFCTFNTLARHLFIRLHYIADPDATSEPSIVVHIEKVSGGTEDVGAEWRRDNGTLPMVDPAEATWTTSNVRVDDELAGEASPSGPRMLAITSGARGVDCLVVFTMTEVRLLSYTIAEFAEASVE